MGGVSNLNKAFAPSYDRDSNGYVIFPRDASYRKTLFPRLKLDEHPAKANIFLVQACIDYVSEPGETVMDVMSGTGTIMTGALIGRRIVCVEIEEFYQNIITMNLEDLDKYSPGSKGMVTIIPGDCAVVLPIPVDHIIFSPPYSNILKKKTVDKWSSEHSMGGTGHYSKSSQNVGNLNDFLYSEKMNLIYKKCYESLHKGGTLTIIIKDHMESGSRIYLSRKAKELCEKIGFDAFSWHRWIPPGSSYVGIRRSRGEQVVDEEEIITMIRNK